MLYNPTVSLNNDFLFKFVPNLEISQLDGLNLLGAPGCIEDGFRKTGRRWLPWGELCRETLEKMKVIQEVTCLFIELIQKNPDLTANLPLL